MEILSLKRARPGRAARAWVALLALWLAGTGSTALAADTMSGLGAAFKPQGVLDVPAPGTVPRAAAAPQGSHPGLRVVVTGAGRSVASIDGQLVHVGDVVNGMRVARIDQQGVLLTGEAGAREHLTVNPAVVKSKRQAQAASAVIGGRQ